MRDVCSQGMVTETSFKVLEVLSFCGWEMAHVSSFSKDYNAIFLGEKEMQ